MEPFYCKCTGNNCCILNFFFLSFHKTQCALPNLQQLKRLDLHSRRVSSSWTRLVSLKFFVCQNQRGIAQSGGKTFRKQPKGTDRREKGFLMQYSFKRLTLVCIHMPKIRSFNATQLSHQKDLPFENLGCFVSCQQRYYYQHYSHAVKEIFVGHWNNTPTRSFPGWAYRKTSVWQIYLMFTPKKGRWSTFHHSENVHLFHADFRLFWWEAALFKHWGP